MRRTAALLAFLLLLASVPAYSQSFTDRTIRPGDSIGSVRLGMTLDDVIGILGRPADTEATEEALKFYRWNLEGDTVAPGGASALAIALNGTNAVEQVTTSSPNFTMIGGAGPGISLEGFKRDLHAPYRGVKDGQGVRHVRFDTEGLDVAYEIRGPGVTTVTAVSVFKPAAAMPSTPAILPGEAIGPVRLGMTVDEAIGAMGRPPQKREKSRGMEALLWVLSDKDPLGDAAMLMVLTQPSGRVGAILTDAVGHTTAQGNGPGTSLLEFQAEFGPAFRSQTANDSDLSVAVSYPQHGIIGFYPASDPQKRILIIAIIAR